MTSTALLNDFTDNRYEIFGSEGDLSIFQPIKDGGGRWESHVARVLSRLIAPTDTCLDIGANIGPFSLLMSDFAYKGQVHAFEPSREIYEHLKTSVEANGRKNIHCHPIGLSDSIGEHEFHTFSSIPGASFGGAHAEGADLTVAVQEVFKYDFPFETAMVPFTTLDQWAEENQIDNVDFITIDVEGNELFALQGGQRILEHSRPKIVTEFNVKAMQSYFSIDPERYYDLLRSLYEHLYLIHENGVSPVSSYDDVVAAMTEQHFWADLLCMAEDIRFYPAARNLVRPPAQAQKSPEIRNAPAAEAERLKVAYVTVVPLSWTNNGGSLVCRSHLRELSVDPALDIAAITLGPRELAGEDKAFIEALGCEAHHVAFEDLTYTPPGALSLPDRLLHQQERIARQYGGVDDAIKQAIERHGSDVVVIDWMFTACYASGVFKLPLPKVIITLNREAEFYASERSVAGDASGRLASWCIWQRLMRLEKQLYGACDGLVALTPNDLPGSLPPHVATQIMPPLLRSRGARWRFRGNKRMFFVGNVNHYPNRLAAEWICTKLAPEVAKIDPEVMFDLIGANDADVPCEWRRPNVHGSASPTNRKSSAASRKRRSSWRRSQTTSDRRSKSSIASLMEPPSPRPNRRSAAWLFSTAPR